MKIITLGKYGALGNNFFRFIHACAYAREYDAELYYSDRRNIDKFFKVDNTFIHNKSTSWFLNSRLLLALLKQVGKCPWLVKLINQFGIYVHDHTNRIQKDKQLALFLTNKRSIVFVLRDFRAHSSLKKCVDEMRSAFDVRPELTTKIGTLYKELRKKYKILLGVHIRRGDYKEWHNGKYYFSDETFYNKITEFIEWKGYLRSDVGVIICSNGHPLMENFQDLNAYFETRPEEEDLFLMKRCDFIIAPPSTFCSMSSFMGSVPLYFIENEEIKEFEERFHVCSY
jgi:hypothetical protein